MEVFALIFLIMLLRIPFVLHDTKKWKSVATFDEYKEKMQQAGKSANQCERCDSKSIRDVGFKKANSSERLFKCNSCGYILHRG